MENLKAIMVALLLVQAVSGITAQIRDEHHSIIGEEYVFPFQNEHVHGSSMVFLPNGDLLACWFQGSGERTANDCKDNGGPEEEREPGLDKSFPHG